jgi:putative ABC transport system permease protein
MLHDLGLAVRQLVRQPALSASIILLIALGVATNTALFSVIDGLLFKPLPFHDSARLVAIDFDRVVFRAYGRTADELAAAKDALERTPLLGDRALVKPGMLFDEGTAAVGELGLVDAVVSRGFFDTLGVRPLLGRALDDNDSRQPVVRAILLGYDLWRSRLGGDPSVVGRTIVLGGKRLEVAGVMPPDFDFPRGTTVWAAGGRFGRSQPNLARLADGVSLAQLRRQFPKLTIKPLRDSLRPANAFTLAFLLAATGLVLLVAWIQVAALQLARAAARSVEIGIRLALGATRARLVRQFAAEGLVLAATALATAWLATPALTSAVMRWLPVEMTRGQHVSADLRTFAFACLAATLGVLLFALLPVEIIRHSAPSAVLRGTPVGRTRLTAARARTVMLVAQLAVTTTLLYITGLAFQSYTRVNAVDLGFTPARVVAIALPSLTDAFASAGREQNSSASTAVQAIFASQSQRAADLVDAIGGLPGVTNVAAAMTYPLTSGAFLGAAGIRTDGGPRSIPTRINWVTPQFFRTLGIRVVEGRGFEGRTPVERQAVAVVNQAMARELRPYGPVVGRQIDAVAFRGRIGGIVNDSVDDRPDLPADPQVYLPATGLSLTAKVLVRTSGDPTRSLPAIQAAVKRTWGTTADRRVVRLEDEIVRATSAYRARTMLLGLLALEGLSMALVGLVGALMYSTRQRTREIAIRIALGAEPPRIRRHVVTHALLCAATAFVLGLAGGVAVGRWASSLLFGVQPIDATTIGVVAVLLGAAAWGAAFVPARRAAGVDPATALRDE